MFGVRFMKTRVMRNAASFFVPSRRYLFGRNKRSGEKKSYYEYLGVEKTATAAEIKEAYFKLAKTQHPDINQEKGAKDNFSEINEAYQTLKNEESRKIYDKTGLTIDEQKQSGFNFANFGKAAMNLDERKEKVQKHYDEYVSLFKMESSITKNTPIGVTMSGDVIYQKHDFSVDIIHNIQIEFSQLWEGISDGYIKRIINYTRDCKCPECQGHKKAPGSKVEKCGLCSGAGSILIHNGEKIIRINCENCQQAGKFYSHPCFKCKMTGIVREPIKIEVKIPVGIKDGDLLRVKGKGN